MSSDVGARRKRRWVRLVQRYLLNPLYKAGVWYGFVPGHALIETMGNKTGRRRRTVVGVDIDGDCVWIVAEQGRHAGYVRNLEVTPQVRLRLKGKWTDGVAHINDDDDPRQRLDSFGRPQHAAIVRRLGTELLSIRIDLASAASS